MKSVLVYIVESSWLWGMRRDKLIVYIGVWRSPVCITQSSFILSSLLILYVWTHTLCAPLYQPICYYAQQQFIYTLYTITIYMCVFKTMAYTIYIQTPTAEVIHPVALWIKIKKIKERERKSKRCVPVYRKRGEEQGWDWAQPIAYNNVVYYFLWRKYIQ